MCELSSQVQVCLNVKPGGREQPTIKSLAVVEAVKSSTRNFESWIMNIDDKQC